MFGVCIVTFASEDVIASCLDSLRGSEDQGFRVVILDNASTDATCDRIRDWVAGTQWSFAEQELAEGAPAGANSKLTLLRSGQNLGFAGGVNRCLEAFNEDPEVAYFWVLNPDSEATPKTIGAYRKMAETAGDFALMGGRTIYHETPDTIQSDGGRVNFWTGICSNLNQGQHPREAMMPPAPQVDFISGANMVASRLFLSRVGPMQEDYFLFYEEVDWAQRRGELPLLLCKDAAVYHHGGTAIGSGSTTRRATGFANYFNYRNRMRFVWRFRPYAIPVAYAYSLLKIVKLLLLGAWREAVGAFRGLHQLPPPAEVYQRISWPPPKRPRR